MDRNRSDRPLPEQTAIAGSKLRVLSRCMRTEVQELCAAHKNVAGEACWCTLCVDGVGWIVAMERYNDVMVNTAPNFERKLAVLHLLRNEFGSSSDPGDIERWTTAPTGERRIAPAAVKLHVMAYSFLEHLQAMQAGDETTWQRCWGLERIAEALSESFEHAAVAVDDVKRERLRLSLASILDGADVPVLVA